MAATSPPRCRCRGPRPPTTAAASVAAPNSTSIYEFAYAATDKTVIAYCRIGERSSHTWFVLTHLLGIAGVRNYDGSWTEWGNTVRVPIAVGRRARERARQMSMPAACCAEVVSDFADVQGQDKLRLLLEFSEDLPPLPADLEEAAMEPVPECQSPLFLHVDAADRGHVRLYFSAPAEAPTTRGFAVDPGDRTRRPGRGRHPGRARRLLHRTGFGRADQPTAAARNVRHARPHQAPADGTASRDSRKLPTGRGTGSPTLQSRRINCPRYILKDVS